MFPKSCFQLDPQKMKVCLHRRPKFHWVREGLEHLQKAGFYRKDNMRFPQPFYIASSPSSTETTLGNGKDLMCGHLQGFGNHITWLAVNFWCAVLYVDVSLSAPGWRTSGLGNNTDSSACQADLFIAQINDVFPKFYPRRELDSSLVIFLWRLFEF